MRSREDRLGGRPRTGSLPQGNVADGTVVVGLLSEGSCVRAWFGGCMARLAEVLLVAGLARQRVAHGVDSVVLGLNVAACLWGLSIR